MEPSRAALLLWFLRPAWAYQAPQLFPRAPPAHTARLRLLAVGDEVPSELLNQLLSRRSVAAGKRAVIFFFEADVSDACAVELKALDDVGGELYLRATDIVGVRTQGGAAKYSVKYSFVNFIEDRRDRIKTALGVPSPASYVVDATGTVVSACTASGGHAARALEFAMQNGWEREAGWERDFGGVTDAEPPPAEARWEADAERRLESRRALNLADPVAEAAEEQGIFGEWKDPDEAVYPNPIGRNLQGVGEKLKQSARSALDDVLDGVDEMKEGWRKREEK